MLGINLLIRLGRSVLKGPVTDAGLLPAKVYRHLVLAAIEDEDFPGALGYLQWADDPLLAQILVLRLRLLLARHARQRQAILECMGSAGCQPALSEKYRHLLQAEDQAMRLLGEYESNALALANPVPASVPQLLT